MSSLNNGFGATLEGFSAVSTDELMQVGGGLWGITWSDVKKAAKFVAATAATVLIGRVLK